MVSTDILLESPTLLGARVKRMEDPRLITSAGSYIDDVKLAGTLHMQIVRSPFPHAPSHVSRCGSPWAALTVSAP